MLVAKTIVRDRVIYFIAARNIIYYHGIQWVGIIWNLLLQPWSTF